MTTSSSHRVVLITGASSGIGAALAQEFARQGADLVLAARRKDRLDQVAQRVRELGRRALIVECDVCRDGDLERATELALREFGRLDIVVANAGFGVVGNVEALTLDDYRRQFETNVYGVIRTAYATLAALKNSNGIFAALGSVAGHVSLPGASAYSMSKYAVRAFAEAFRREVAHEGVAVVLVSPGFVESEIRSIDNHGKQVAAKAGSSESERPNWLVMPTDRAARQIARGILGRKSEVIITGHGKFAIALSRFAPWAIDLVVGAGIRGRKPVKS
jgi:short-subunit dehydrogenase